jgi:DNA-binding response OmpR family regulator
MNEIGTTTAPPNAAPSTILVADDEPDFRMLFAHHLGRLGHTVHFAGDGEQVLTQLRSQPFDLLLLDLRMPGTGGLNVLQRLREHPAPGPLPIIVVTAHGDPDTAVACLNLGAEDFLEKPVRPTILKHRVNAVLLRYQYQQRQSECLAQLQLERDRSDSLLRTLLPEPIARELLATETVVPRRHAMAAVFFADIVNFTQHTADMPLPEVHANLQRFVSAFEDISRSYGVEKIKTMGDCYMGAAGLLDTRPDPVGRCAAACLQMTGADNGLPQGWQVHAGIDAGPVAAGIIGHHRYRYDIWGDTVNTAARVQYCADPGQVCLSERAWAQLGDRAQGGWRGPFDLRGKPQLRVFELQGLTVRAQAG